MIWSVDCKRRCRQTYSLLPFDRFDSRKINSGGAGAYNGFGFNFTTKYNTTYEKNGIQAYLKAERPLSSNRKTMSLSKITKANPIRWFAPSQAIIQRLTDQDIVTRSTKLPENFSRAVDRHELDPYKRFRKASYEVRFDEDGNPNIRRRGLR